MYFTQFYPNATSSNNWYDYTSLSTGWLAGSYLSDAIARDQENAKEIEKSKQDIRSFIGQEV